MKFFAICLLFLSFSVNSALISRISAQSQMTVTVTFDQATYSQGGTVNISGKVTDLSGNAVSGATVSIQVVDPSGNTKKADFMITAVDGTYVSQFRLASDALIGVYTTFVVASKTGFVDARAQNTFQITPTSQTSTASTSSSTASTTSTSTSTTSTTSTSSSTASTTSTTTTATSQPGRRGCLIATATFGTDTSPEVVFLREFRDKFVERTKIGAAFVQIYDKWYYSFSPQISNVISATPSLKNAMRLTMYPLLVVLHATASLASFGLEEEARVLMAGVFSSLAVGAVYLSPMFLIPYRAATRGRMRAVRVKELILPTLAGATFTLLALAIDSELMLEMGVAILAISSAAAGAIIVLEVCRRLGQYF